MKLHGHVTVHTYQVHPVLVGLRRQMKTQHRLKAISRKLCQTTLEILTVVTMYLLCSGQIVGHCKGFYPRRQVPASTRPRPALVCKIPVPVHPRSIPVRPSGCAAPMHPRRALLHPMPAPMRPKPIQVRPVPAVVTARPMPDPVGPMPIPARRVPFPPMRPRPIPMSP